jgi:hypothetical protein
MSQNTQNYRLWFADRDPATSNRFEQRHAYLNRGSAGQHNWNDLVELLRLLVATNESDESIRKDGQ